MRVNSLYTFCVLFIGIGLVNNVIAQTDTLIKKLDTGTVISADTPASAPFAFGDFSWLNGTSRKTSAPAFDSKYFTGDITFDFNYGRSLNNPIDHTVVGSTALARNNELQLSFMGVGGDIHVGNIRGRIMMQFGTRSTVVPRNDGSSYRGQYDLQTIYRYISEAYVGY
ncbi:MAG: porin, partial [Bacteroidota bacterium]|nr:porin [Bacteroidota bacterium]